MLLPWLWRVCFWLGLKIFLLKFSCRLNQDQPTWKWFISFKSVERKNSSPRRTGHNAVDRAWALEEAEPIKNRRDNAAHKNKRAIATINANSGIPTQEHEISNWAERKRNYRIKKLVRMSVSAPPQPPLSCSPHTCHVSTGKGCMILHIHLLCVEADIIFPISCVDLLEPNLNKSA